MKILETQRLILRTTKNEDIKALYKELFSNKEVVKYTFGKELNSYEEVEKFIQENCNYDSLFGLSTIIKKDTKEVIGLGGAIRCEYLNEEDYEIGFIFSQKFWGKGYAQEIGQAQITFIKENTRVKRALALVDSENQASVNTIKKLGLTFLSKVDTLRGKRDVYLLRF